LTHIIVTQKKLDNPDFCKEVLENLVKKAEMTKLTEPVIVHADSNETLGGKDPGGYSGFVMIVESHISIHTFTKRGFVTIDLYSCKPFKTEGVIEYLSEALETDTYDVIRMDRGLKYPAENIY
jgi:S-adenosylmethionine decarboxylase